MAKEIIKHEHGGQPRASVNFTRKYNLGNYSNMDISVGLTDDCVDETPQEGIQRVAKLVQAEFESLCNKIEGKIGGKK
jgi:hypothetical protein